LLYDGAAFILGIKVNSAREGREMDEKLRKLHVSREDIGIFLLLFFGWWLSSAGLLVKYFHSRTGILVLVGGFCIAAILYGLRWLQSRSDSQIHWAWFAAFWMVMVGIYAVLYPIANSHVFGRGSDSEDALRVAASQMLQCHFPYYPRTYLGDPITPMPGALLLATPFLMIGRVSFQNPVWLGLLILSCLRFFRFRSSALAFLVVTTLANAIALENFVVGADFFVNVWYICITTHLFLRACEKSTARWQFILASILLGIALSSRAVYIVIPPLLLAYLMQHEKGVMIAISRIAVPVVTAIVVTAPFYFYDPAHFSPLHVVGKLNFLSTEYRGPVLILLPALGLIIACAGFFMRLTLPRLYLLVGLSSAVILIPPGLIWGFWDHFSEDSLGLLSYGGASAAFVSLWAISRFESEFGIDQTAAG
jgi:hypothetical protein